VNLQLDPPAPGPLSASFESIVQRIKLSLYSLGVARCHAHNWCLWFVDYPVARVTVSRAVARIRASTVWQATSVLLFKEGKLSRLDL